MNITTETQKDKNQRIDAMLEELGAFIKDNKAQQDAVAIIEKKIQELDGKYDINTAVLTGQITLPGMKKPEAPRKRPPKSDIIDRATFDDYVNLFVQRDPVYGVKSPYRGTWNIRQKHLFDISVRAHLKNKYDVAVVSRWYPEYTVIDIDSQTREFVDDLRDRLNLDENNSMLFSSESPDSYHLLLRPQYNGTPPTSRLLHDVFRVMARELGVEIYPKAKKPIRLPMGPKQRPLDGCYAHLKDWDSKLYWFLKLNEYDLSEVKYHQQFFDFEPIGDNNHIPPNVLEDGKELLKHGLQCPSSREQSQFRVLLYLWRQNVARNVAEEMTWDWIRTKHNGMSKDIASCPRAVRSHISRQASIIYDKYDAALVYPDNTHNRHNGFITKPDIPDIIAVTGASLPRARFLFNIVKFSYPRRLKSYVSVQRKKLVSWGSHSTYLRYLGELENKGIVERGNVYQPGKLSKDLRLNWEYRDDKEAVMWEGRSIETFESTIKSLYAPDEFRQLLAANGAKRTTAYEAVRSIFNVSENDTHNN